MSIEALHRSREEFLAALAAAGTDPESIEAVRVRFAGRRSGLLRDLEETLKGLPREEKPAYGKALNELKRLVEEQLARRGRGRVPGEGAPPAWTSPCPGDGRSSARCTR